MIRFGFTLFFILIFKINSACAYEFKQLNHFFDLLQNDYINEVDVKQLFFKSSALMTEFDHDIHFYHTDSKAYLYEKNQLVGAFSLPSSDEPGSWKKLMTDILLAGVNHSQRIYQQSHELENAILNIFVKNLDSYSRIEKNTLNHLAFEATLKNNVIYVKLNTFIPGQTESLKQIIQQYDSADGLILDLRNNRGGQFNEAIELADLFLDNVLITYSIEKNRPQRFYQSHSGDILKEKPIAVLINEHTASAAEIVAAALNEQNRAILIGSKTFGKGSIQQIHEIDKRLLYLTSGYFYSPSGKKINETGIMPQICTGDENCIHSDEKSKEKDITKALEFIKNKLG